MKHTRIRKQRKVYERRRSICTACIKFTRVLVTNQNACTAGSLAVVLSGLGTSDLLQGPAFETLWELEGHGEDLRAAPKTKLYGIYSTGDQQEV